MAPMSKKRKAAELETEQEQTKLANGHPSPCTEDHQETPPLLGLEASPDIPFKLTSPAMHTTRKPKTGKADVFGPEEEDGGFSERLRTTYTVKPGSKWGTLKPYRNFIVADNKFSLGSHVYISHANSPKDTSDYKFVASPDKMEPDFWVAKVLEVRASDQQHVYLRVFWLYWPDELPDGRQSYHGQNEVIMSNHMDIIDATTVSGGADVRWWQEKDEDEELPSLFFRQFYNVAEKNPLSELRRHCICHSYYNPDTTLLKCNNPECGIWLHEQCLTNDILLKTYKQLVVEGKQEVKTEEATPEIKEVVPGTPKHSIFSSSHLGDMFKHPLEALRATMSPAPEPKSEPEPEIAMVADTALVLSPDATSTPTPKTNGKTPSKTSLRKSRGRPKKGTAAATDTPGGPSAKAKTDDLTLAKEQFSARIETGDASSTTAAAAAAPKEGDRITSTIKIVITDLRPGQPGGNKTWKEDVYCLKCGKQLD